MERYIKRFIAVILAIAVGFSMMPMQKIQAVSSVIFSEEQEIAIGSYGSERSVLFNDGWKFYLGKLDSAKDPEYNDASWMQVTLPHDFSIRQTFTTNGEAESGFLPGGTGWYRKKFTLPDTCEGKRVVLNFDGVYSHALVYINGSKVGEHHYGYTSFAFDITDYVTCDGATENVVAVQATNNIPSSRWYSGSGIYRDVKMLITDPVHVAWNGTYVTTPDIENHSGTVDISVDVENDSAQTANVTVRNRVFEKNGTEAVASAETEVRIEAHGTKTVNADPVVPSPRLWSLEEPILYYVRTEIIRNGEVIDTYDTTFGFKWYRFVDNTGFQLNGKNVKIQGVCMHHDQGALGSAAYYDAMYRQLFILKDMGVNTIRATHNPYDEDFVDICNELGIMVIEEAFDGWAWPKNGNYNDFSTHFNTQLTSDNHIIDGDSSMTWAEFAIKSMVKRDRNDPSIILWSLGNEIQEGVSNGYSKDWSSIAVNLIQWVKEVDTVHPTTSGSNDRSAGGVVGAVNGLIYQNGGVPGFNYGSGSDMDSLHNTYPVILYSETASAVTSRGIYVSQESRANADGKYHLTSYDTSSVGWGKTAHDSMWEVATRDYLAGECVWTGFDYIGEPTPWNGTGTGSVSGAGAIPNSSYFGIVDTAGFPKDTYYLYRSQWNKKENTLHLVTAWDSDNMMVSNGKTPVWVYSNAARIELYRDNKKVGTATRKVNTTAAGHTYYTYTTQSNNSSLCSTSSGSNGSSLYAVFQVAFTEGTISAKAYDESGNEITGTCAGNTSVSTPGTAGRLEVKKSTSEIQADGSSLSYIEVEVQDAQGNLDTTAVNTIQFTLEGAGEIAGADNGDQATVNKYQQSSVLKSATSAQINAYAGKALAIIRSTTEEGGIHVNVTSSGLTGGTAVISSQSDSGSETGENAIVSYQMSKHCYAPVGTSSITLPEKLTASYKDGSTAQLSVTWDSYDNANLQRPGLFTIEGTMSDEVQRVKVSLTVHVYDTIAGAENYSAITRPGEMPVLPGTVMTFYADGTEFEEFPVSWNTGSLSESSFEKEGEIVIIEGSVSAPGGTCPVTASIRVAAPIEGEIANIAPVASSLTESCPVPADTLESLRDGRKYSPAADGTSLRWTNWNSRGDAALTMTWDTAHTVNQINLFYYITATGGMPENVTFRYSLNGKDFTEIGYESPVRIPDVDGANVEDKDKVLNGYSYTFTQSINPVAIQIFMEQKSGSNAFLGLTEAEVMATSYTYPANTSAVLDGISINGTAVSAFNALDTEYEVHSLENITVSSNQNVAVTILPATDDSVTILTVSEDGRERKTYRLLLAKSTEEEQLEKAKQNLRDAIAEAGEKLASDYTQESYAELQRAKTSAENVLADTTAGKEAIDAARAELQNALVNLQPADMEDTTEVLRILNETIAEAEGKAEENYTKESYENLKNALAEAKKLPATSSKAEIETVNTKLREALESLVRATEEPTDDTEIKEEKARLDSELEKAAGKDETEYTKESFDVLKAAVAKAESVKNNPEAKVEEIKEAFSALQSALLNLQLKSSKETEESENGGSNNDNNNNNNSNNNNSNNNNSNNNNNNSNNNNNNSNNNNNNNNNSNNNSSNNNGNGGQNQTPDPGIRLPEKGKTYSVGLAYYRVTVFSETEKTVTYVKPKRKNLKTITIPASVKIEGVTFQVTAIADKACWKNGKLSKVIVGRNVKVIGKSAFAGDRKLKSMIVKSMSLKKVGKSALKGIHAGCRITVGKKQLKKYTKLFRGKGQKASVKVGLQ